MNTFTYFYFMHAEYARKLDRPITEYITDSDGYTVGSKTRDTETSQSFNAGTLVSDKPLTKFDLFLKVRDVVLNETNDSRRESRMILFRVSDMVVTAFDGGRNEL